MTDPRDDGDGADPPPVSESADPDAAPDDPGDRPPEPAGDPGDASAEPGAATADSDATADRTVVAESVETPGEPRTLDPRVRYEWIVGPLIGAAVLGGFAAVAGWQLAVMLERDQTTFAVGAGVVAFALLAVYGVLRTIYLYRSWRYVVRPESLYLTHGVFTLVQTVVPYVRVQHIDTRRSAFERVLGLSTLVVYTAGSRGADVTIPGLTPDRADDLQSRLERLAIESEDEDAV